MTLFGQISAQKIKFTIEGFDTLNTGQFINLVIESPEGTKTQHFLSLEDAIKISDMLSEEVTSVAGGERFGVPNHHFKVVPRDD